MQSVTKVTLLAGGVGGARMAAGFAARSEVELTVIVNVGDDDVIYGVHVAADLDTVTYTLAGEVGEPGWGRRGDTWRVMEELAYLGWETDFRLGDADLAVNLYRTERLRAGARLHEITDHIRRRFDVGCRLLPASNDPVRTQIETIDGEVLDFQTYFVRRRHRDRVRSVTYRGIETARAAPGVVEAIDTADLVILAPSNPILSLLPIVTIPDIDKALSRLDRLVAVSPLVGGKAVKGPLTQLMESTGHPVDHASIVTILGRVTHLVGDTPTNIDGVSTLVTDTLIPTVEASSRLAGEILRWVI